MSTQCARCCRRCKRTELVQGGNGGINMSQGEGDTKSELHGLFLVSLGCQKLSPASCQLDGDY